MFEPLAQRRFLPLEQMAVLLHEMLANRYTALAEHLVTWLSDVAFPAHPLPYSELADKTLSELENLLFIYEDRNKAATYDSDQSEEGWSDDELSLTRSLHRRRFISCNV